MSSERSRHVLDEKLSDFDDFIDGRPLERGGLIYSFLGPSKVLDNSADISSLRVVLQSTFIYQLYKISGKDFVLSTTENESLFSLLRSEFGWSFPGENTIEEDGNSLELQRKSLEINSAEVTIVKECDSCGHSDDRLSFEFLEAAKIVSLLASSRRTNVDHPYLIAVVPERSSRSWSRIKKQLEDVLVELLPGKDFKITTITIGSVTFVNHWARTLLDYFHCRRQLVDVSYRHKSSHEDVPAKIRNDLTFATIIFELMAHPPRRPILIERTAYREDRYGEKEELLPQWARNGAFVMYNYARLEAILEKYSQGVEKGKYPVLEPLDYLDEDMKSKILQEMSRLVDFLSSARKVAVTVDNSSNDTSLKLPNLRDTMFNFSREFSRYYSKRRVLPEVAQFNDSAAAALRTKIHILRRFKSLFLLWFRLLSIHPVPVM